MQPDVAQELKYSWEFQLEWNNGKVLQGDFI